MGGKHGRQRDPILFYASHPVNHETVLPVVCLRFRPFLLEHAREVRTLEPQRFRGFGLIATGAFQGLFDQKVPVVFHRLMIRQITRLPDLGLFFINLGL